MDDIRGHLVLLMAPSGSGKNTLIEGLAELREQLYFAKTVTSRPRRNAEENPKYEFISREQFIQLIKAKELIEWAEFSGNYYGTPKSEVISTLKEPHVVFKEMELQGVKQIKQLVPDERLTIIYIDAGPWSELRERIITRASITEEELEGRRQRYLEEVQFKEEAEIIISNHNGENESAQHNFRMVIRGIINSL